MVPAFVYIVEGLLVTTILIGFVILCTPSWRKTNLRSEPASIASLMLLVCKDHSIVENMGANDSATSQQLEELFQRTTFTLQREIDRPEPTLRYIGPDVRSLSKKDLLAGPAVPILPPELSWRFGLGLITLQGLVVAGLAYVYVRAHLHNGLPLPSTSLFINQIMVKYLPMVVGAFFEPIFTWLTRTLCMLQPYEQLRRGNAAASRSLDATYNSLPPQAVMFAALKPKYISLASICWVMTSLANVVSVAFSGVLYEHAILLPIPQNFTVDFQLPINSSGISYAHSKMTYDHFYVAMSNLTAGTPLPAWTDEKFFYVPFQDSHNISSILGRARTPAISASLHCYPIYQRLAGKSLTWDMAAEGPSCNFTSLPTYILPKSTSSRLPEAIEYMKFISSASDNDTPLDCDLTVLAGWGRSSTRSTNQPLNPSWIACQPQLRVEVREVTVNYQGLAQSSTPIDDIMERDNHVLRASSNAIIDAFHTLLEGSNIPQYPHDPSTYSFHNDSYPSDFYNYLIAQTLNSSATLEPLVPPPSFNTTAPVMEALYTRLFAIVLGTHYDTVLQPTDQKLVAAGFTLSPEIRIFVSTPMFFLSIAILSAYILFTVTLYIRRPWKILPRLPTTIISQIPFFAASHMLQDLSIMSGTSGKDKSSDPKETRQRYGFGRFMGTDGKTHIGIEREPLVQTLSKKDLRLMQNNASSL